MEAVGEPVLERCNMTKAQPGVAGLAGTKSQEPRNAGGLSAGRGKETDSPLEPPGRNTALPTP